MRHGVNAVSWPWLPCWKHVKKCQNYATGERSHPRSGWWEELRLKHVETPKTTRKKPWFPVDFSISSDMVRINNRLSFQHCGRWPQPPKAFQGQCCRIPTQGRVICCQVIGASGFNQNHRQWVKNHHWGATAGHHPWIESWLSKYVASQTPSTLANHQILGFDPSPYQHLWGCHSGKQTIPIQFQWIRTSSSLLFDAVSWAKINRQSLLWGWRSKYISGCAKF